MLIQFRVELEFVDMEGYVSPPRSSCVAVSLRVCFVASFCFFILISKAGSGWLTGQGRGLQTRCLPCIEQCSSVLPMNGPHIVVSCAHLVCGDPALLQPHELDMRTHCRSRCSHQIEQKTFMDRLGDRC